MARRRRRVTRLPTAMIAFAPQINLVEKEEEVANEALVEETVTWIRAKVAQTIFQGASDIGDYVLEKFFGNDPERVRSRSPKKSRSFRSLLDHCATGALPLRKSALHAAVSVAMMRRLLPSGATAFRQLSPSHQVTLLPLHDLDKVENVARQAVSTSLSVRELRRMVKEEVAKIPIRGKRRGRRPIPIVLKTLNRSLREFTVGAGKRSFTKAQFDKLSEGETRRALSAAEELRIGLDKLVEKLKARK